VLWTEEELRAVSGFGVFNSIPNLSNGAARIDPVPGRLDFLSAEFKLVVPHDLRYNPVSNPNGARSTVYDHTINAYGLDRNTGFARRPLDNVGIQYGLGALNTGEISKEQFLDLNEKIGGLDIDANFIPERMVANRKAMQAAYKTGRLLHGSGLATIPILDYDRIYSDLAPGGDIHMKFQHFSTRERLIEANGHADNQVMWSGGAGPDARRTAIEQAALAAIDEWVANIKNDATADPLAQKVVRNKPVDLVDGCWTKDVPPAFIAEPQFFGGVDPSDTFVCNDLYPAFPFPRLVAGGPLANNIIKCQLKPVDFSDYEVMFTPAEQMRLLRIFPNGVCDWTQPGVEQQGLVGTWLTFTGIGKYKRDEPADPERD
jgi:hypothetical protein